MHWALIIRGRGWTATIRAVTALVALLGALAFALAHGPHPARATSGVAIANPYGQSMFGISTNGGLQDVRPSVRNRELAADQAAGAKWLRMTIDWASIQPTKRGRLYWTRTDALIKAAQARGMAILGDIMYTPRWASATKHCTDARCRPNPFAYARFARLAAKRYGSRGVAAYEIWNEENTAGWVLPHTSPAAYAKLLKLAYPAIKQVEPQATVITGGMSPSLTQGGNYSPVDYLAALYRAGAKPYFDALGAHPSCWPAYPGQAYWWSSWYQTVGAKHSLRNLMLQHGDGHKLIWATEFGAATYGPKGSYVSLKQQAAMIYDAYKLWATYRWAGPMMVFEARDEYKYSRMRDRLDFQGLEFVNFKPKPAFAAYQRAVAKF